MTDHDFGFEFDDFTTTLSRGKMMLLLESFSINCDEKSDVCTLIFKTCFFVSYYDVLTQETLYPSSDSFRKLKLRVDRYNGQLIC